VSVKDMKDCPPYLREYIFYLRVIKNRSEKTIESYYLDIRLFFRYINENLLPNKPENPDIIINLPFEAVAAVTMADVYEYLNYTTEECGCGEKTRHRKVVALKGFYKALASNKLTSYHIKENPLQNLEVPSPRKTSPKYLDLDDSRRLLDKLDSENKYYERDFCILMLFLNCGMRLSELVGIDLQDINLEDRSLRILGKGNKERILHINEGCAKAIIGYMGVRPAADTNAFFLSSRNTRISGRRVEQIVENALKANGLDGRGLSVHKLRHTAATLMYQYGGVDALVLKEVLGHASVATTEIYTHLTNENVRTALDSNPLSQETAAGTRHKGDK